jgi:hypothetical protein
MVEHVLLFVLRGQLSQMPKEAAATFIRQLAFSAPPADTSELMQAVGERIAELLGKFCNRLENGQTATVPAGPPASGDLQ